MNNASYVKARRAEYLVELFLESAVPAYFGKAEDEKFPFDFLVGFKSPTKKVKNFFVEVKASDKPVGKEFHFLANRRQREYFSNSDMPVILFAVDTKQNKLFYGFAGESKAINLAYRANLYELAVPVHEASDPKKFVADLVSSKR